MFRLNIVNDIGKSAFMSTIKLNDSIIWHARLGHVHFKRMQDISKDGLIPTFDMDTEKCKTCMLTRITKKPFQNVKRKTEVLELIYSDLCDLHPTPSLGNKKYFVTFIDDASRSIGIIHEMTAPYTPQQNGISKRKNRVLKEMVNSMLSYSGLSQGFWGEVMLTTCYLLNRVPDKIVRLPDLKLKTLGEKGIECIFVGYAEHSKAFRFSSVPKPSLRIPNGTEDIGGSVVPEEVIEVEQGTRSLTNTPIAFNVEDDPKIFDEAMKSQDVAFWKEAINDEIDSIMGNNTWVLSNLPPGCKPLDCKWIFKRKLKMDVKTAFLNGELEEEVYMIQPQGFIMPVNENKMCKLVKSLYGLKQTPNHWHQKFDEVVDLTKELSFAYMLMTCKQFRGHQTLAAAGKEAEWLRNLILEIPLWSKPIASKSIRCDSAATLAKALA
ncbi:zinc finger, CCHC-type containing protein [Tanacetum coccineum]